MLEVLDVRYNPWKEVRAGVKDKVRVRARVVLID